MITWLVDDFFHLHPIFHIILSAILLLTISFGYVSDYTWDLNMVVSNYERSAR
jgi:hypothetical protein